MDVIDRQLELLAAAVEAALDDERNVQVALAEHREGVGAAATMK